MQLSSTAIAIAASTTLFFAYNYWRARAARSKTVNKKTTKPINVIVVGAGMGALAFVLALRKKRGKTVDTVRIFERSDAIGGTWRDNIYPGCACDVPSVLYSLAIWPYNKFRNAYWSRAYAEQPELLEYILDAYDALGVRPLVQLNSSVIAAEFIESSSNESAKGVWKVTVEVGSGSAAAKRVEVHYAEVVVTAVGQLSNPVIPKIRGFPQEMSSTEFSVANDADDGFAGVPVFHSARWPRVPTGSGASEFTTNNSNVLPGRSLPDTFTGKTVAVVGSAASAIQIVPALANSCCEIYVLQRTAPFVIPRGDGPLWSWWRSLVVSVPGLAKTLQLLSYWQTEAGWLAFRRRGNFLNRAVTRKFSSLISRSVKDDLNLRKAVVPTSNFGCSRALRTDAWLPTLQLPNVHLLHGDAVQELHGNGVLELESGRRIAVDAVVCATGFATTDFCANMTIRGRDGIDLHETWAVAGGAEAFLGAEVPRFPNFFMLLGPNTNLGHSSVLLQLEAGSEFVAAAIDELSLSGARTVEVREEVHKNFNDMVQLEHAQTSFGGDCRSWYRTATGKAVTNWPFTTIFYASLARNFRSDQHFFTTKRD